ncbi:unnamed protein product [Pocillopora meandrina]|uniref:SWIM-type domain-containing protein n=1 Tax=Pocillopora meandrina TaxID=46732 RepID=A0AAU9W3B1_9CNID|nr:unnamed protein product [Pocillopora meandrina]
MNDHISKSGKRIDPTSKAHSVPTSIRKATTFLDDEYLKGISAASDDNYFYFRSHCYHSFRKNDAPHNLKVALCILSGEVKHATCSCVAGKVGFCNHILALLMKICKFSLYECKTVHELENEEDMQPKQACTSSLQRWHRKGRGDYKSTTSNGGACSKDLPGAAQIISSRTWFDEDKLNGIEIKTRSQSECPEWKLERKFRFTASNFGLVISMDAPYLAASPDGKVIDPGCSDQFGLSEVKCPETKYLVTPLDACSDSSFFMEEVDGKPKLKRTHKYYVQVQGLMGVTGAKWCDFIVYTRKGMSIERIPFDVQFWNNLKDTLKLHYFKHFLAIAAREPRA